MIDHVDLEHQRLTVRLGEDTLRVARLSADYLQADRVANQPSVVHGYAATGHVHQGATADATFALGSPELYREWIYTAGSRPRDQLRFYLTDALADLERARRRPIDTRRIRRLRAPGPVEQSGHRGDRSGGSR